MLLERPKMSRPMWDALKIHIMRERQRKKQELEADAEMDRQRKERERQQKQHVLTLSETREQITASESRLAELKEEKHQLFLQLKKVLNEDEIRKRQLYTQEAAEMMRLQFSYSNPPRIQLLPTEQGSQGQGGQGQGQGGHHQGQGHPGQQAYLQPIQLTRAPASVSISQPQAQVFKVGQGHPQGQGSHHNTSPHPQMPITIKRSRSPSPPPQTHPYKFGPFKPPPQAIPQYAHQTLQTQPPHRLFHAEPPSLGGGGGGGLQYFHPPSQQQQQQQQQQASSLASQQQSQQREEQQRREVQEQQARVQQVQEAQQRAAQEQRERHSQQVHGVSFASGGSGHPGAGPPPQSTLYTYSSPAPPTRSPQQHHGPQGQGQGGQGQPSISISQREVEAQQQRHGGPGGPMFIHHGAPLPRGYVIHPAVEPHSRSSPHNKFPDDGPKYYPPPTHGLGLRAPSHLSIHPGLTIQANQVKPNVPSGSITSGYPIRTQPNVSAYQGRPPSPQVAYSVPGGPPRLTYGHPHGQIPQHPGIQRYSLPPGVQRD